MEGNSASASGHAGPAQPNANANIGADAVSKLANSSMLAFKPHLAASKLAPPPAPAQPPATEGGDAGSVAAGGDGDSVVAAMLGGYAAGAEEVCRCKGTACCARKRL